MAVPSRLVPFIPGHISFTRTPESSPCLRRQRFRNFVPHILSRLGKFGSSPRRNTIYVVPSNILQIAPKFVMESRSINLEDSFFIIAYHLAKMRMYRYGRCPTAPVFCDRQVNPGLDFDFPPICTSESSMFTAFPKTSPGPGAASSAFGTWNRQNSLKRSRSYF
jgi:hypothetical protein